MEAQIKNIGKYLKESGVRPSEQRIKIFEYLYNEKNHPTVDKIYKSLVDKMPCLSKTTVYNTLNVFLEHNIVKQLALEENEARYDADISVHGHFKCDKCGEIYDFGVSDMKIENDSLKNYEIKEKHIFFRGICQKCSNNKDNID